MVSVATRRLAALVSAGRVELRCADVERLPYDEGSFTRACTVNTVYFWPAPAVAMKELARVVGPGGRLVIGFSPAEAMRKMPKRLTEHGFTLFEPEDMRHLLENAGFGAIEMVPGHGPRGDYLCAIGTRSA
jgi:SAM-dependent methyltransferase